MLNLCAKECGSIHFIAKLIQIGKLAVVRFPPQKVCQLPSARAVLLMQHTPFILYTLIKNLSPHQMRFFSSFYQSQIDAESHRSLMLWVLL